ncbi:right-handed parallel beta-helix repeat-containing protein [Sorangium sp. So ce726]|uniref:right-handed parallel beta-helix repeat-containing protein n=1 Tax=Sorangium sp. So ce726 TaxID=3133319 RepID=UPI003F600FD3
MLFALALVVAGCGADDGGLDASTTSTSEANCAPGEMPLDDGRCQPAGLPLDMPCPPGEMPLEGGGCQPAGLPPDMPCAPGEMPLEGGGCQPAGLPPDMPCAPGEMPLPGGSCQRAGVPPVACGQGFEPDGQRGCTPVLPEGPCPPGQMAIPGESECHEVAPCGEGDYGPIPVDETTQFVNAAYTGTDSDGTRDKPWKRIQDGIDRARLGAIVAVAAGRYAEDLVIRSRRVRLWGRCPALVEVIGTGARVETLAILDGNASGSEVRALAITGPGFGIGMSGASDVLVDHAWIHDTQSEGILVEDSLGPTSVEVKASLIEATKRIAVFVISAEATIDTTVVRGTQPDSGGEYGAGIIAQNSARKRATLTLRRSVVEHNHDTGVIVTGSDATIEATVVRDTQPDGRGRFGRGLSIGDDPDTLERSNVTVLASFLSHNHEFGILVTGSETTIEATVVRDTQPESDGTGGAGIEIENDGRGARATLALRASLLENNHGVGLRVEGSDATVEATAVRGTKPTSDATPGRGVEVFNARKEQATLALRASLVENNHNSGVVIVGAIADIEATTLRGTQPEDQARDAVGITVAGDADTGERAQLALRASLLEQNQYVGAFILGSDATIETTIVRDTQPDSEGIGGDGIVIQEYLRERANASLRAVLLSQNHELGVLVDGSDATLEATVVRDTQQNRDGTMGFGIAIEHQHGRSNVTLRSSVVEKNRAFGISVVGSDATLEATVVRDTQPNRDGAFGRGMAAFVDPDTQERSNVTLRTSLLDRNHDLGALVSGSDATFEATIVRDTRPASNGGAGYGIEIHNDGDTGERAKMTLRSSVVERNHEIGVLMSGSDTTIEATVVRDTQPGDDEDGSGIAIQDNGDTRERANVMLRASLVERNHNSGVLVLGSDATVEATVVRDTQPSRKGWRGHGIHIQDNDETLQRATATLRSVLVEQNHAFGVTVFSSDATIEASVVRDTQAGGDGTRGDGIAVQFDTQPATATITSTAVEANARAGISNFSAAVVLVSSTVQCNRIDLNGEDLVEGQPFSFDGSTENRCGCGGEADPTCAVLSRNLSPPEPISPVDPSR